MANVRAKFVVSNKRTYEYIPGMTQVLMTPVISGSPENEAFFDATPGGEFWATMKESVAESLELGKEYYIDISPAA